MAAFSPASNAPHRGILRRRSFNLPCLLTCAVGTAEPTRCAVPRDKRRCAGPGRAPTPRSAHHTILRQLLIQAAELAEAALAGQICGRVKSRSDPVLVPRWTARRAWARVIKASDFADKMGILHASSPRDANDR